MLSMSFASRVARRISASHSISIWRQSIAVKHKYILCSIRPSRLNRETMIPATNAAPFHSSPSPSSASQHSSCSSPSQLPLGASGPPSIAPNAVRCFVSIGANLGLRVQHIQKALTLLQRTPGLHLHSTSFLYETSPVGSPSTHQNQPRYLNAVLEIHTELPPLELLDRLQAIENECGRVRDASGIRNTPRTLDLDLLFYRDAQFQMDHPRLQLPHPRWMNRGFVLAPLCDLVLSPSIQPVRDETVKQKSALDSVRNAVQTACAKWTNAQQALRTQSKPAASTTTPAAIEKEDMRRVIPFLTEHCKPCSIHPANSDVWRWGNPIVALGMNNPTSVDPFSTATDAFPRSVLAPTIIMGILNLTPDSFSDGGKHTSSLEASVKAAEDLWNQGADIIDIGGESTRPGSVALTPEQELDRILPVIQALRSRFPLMKLSVDTYHPFVARKALEAGVIMLNDVCGGTFSERGETMLSVAAEFGVPYVCMHIRGNTQTMGQLASYTNPVQEIKQEQEQQFAGALQTRVAMSDKSANTFIPRWNLISDPGVGFAKSGPEALKLLRDVSKVRPFDDFPQLIGTSRKGFLVKILNKSHEIHAQSLPSTAAPLTKVTLDERDWATSATVTASIAAGAHIIRVHDVKQMKAVRDIADQIYKQ